VSPGPLCLDYDARDTVPSIGALTWLLGAAGVQPVALQQRRSPGGKGWHVLVWCEPAPRTCMEVAALQAVLGSDQRREACNIQRARIVDARPRLVSTFWSERWNVLYD
jgi:hypothetical protein